MRALILIAGAALAMAAPAAAHVHGERRADHDNYESPYSTRSTVCERERKEFAREIAKAEREERRKERVYRTYDRDNDADEGDDEDDRDDR